MEGWNGGLGVFRREIIGSNVSSSRSGTIASRPSSTTVYTSTRFSNFSTFSSGMIHGVDWELEARTEEKETEEERIRSLVQEFVNCSGDDMMSLSVVERWLTEMRVGWVLSLHGASAGDDLGRSPWTWTQALHQIGETICLVWPLFPDSGSVSVVLRPSSSICEEQEQHVYVPDKHHLMLFIRETMLKVLTFVDVVVAWYPDRIEFLPMDWFMYTKLFDLLLVHGALSEASDKIVSLFLFDSPTTSVETERIGNEMATLLSTYKSKVSEAIRSVTVKIRTKSMEDGDGNPLKNPEPSSDIHKVTRSAMKFIRFLLRNYALVDAAILPSSSTENVRASDSMIMEMVSCLQEKLASIAQSIPDEGLRFFFLLNNSYFIQESLSFYCLQQPSLHADLSDQTESHMERYLQVSWAPLLSCLFHPTLFCLGGKNYCPLSKFESEFQKIYSTQKQWKNPHPNLKRRLREVIIDKIIPGYIEYIEDNNVADPKFSPQKLEAMLQELFEG